MKTRWLRAGCVACLVLVATVVDGIMRPVSVEAEDSAWTGEYYSNPWLNGPPTIVRVDDSIDFD